jgi:hypothetical protein
MAGRGAARSPEGDSAPDGWSPYTREHTKEIREAAPSEAAYNAAMDSLWNAIHNFDPLGPAPEWWTEDDDLPEWDDDGDY